jgi:ABC-2 type transport system permease protein
MRRIFGPFIRISAFFNKELAEILRQPRLILSLILGPFLILFLFGIGYHNQPRAVRTLFVADPGSPLGKQIQSYAGGISPELIYAGVIADQNQALGQLRQGNVDLVAVAPSNAYQTVRSNHQAVFTLYHNEVDPSQASYIQYLGQLYVDEVNRRVISSLAGQGQAQSASFQQDLSQARQNGQAMKSALQAGDAASARQSQAKMQANISGLAIALGASVGLLNCIQQNVGSPDSPVANTDPTGILQDLHQNVDQNAVPDGAANYSGQIARIDKALADIDKLNGEVSDFRAISPDILVRPFAVDTHSISTVDVTAVDFFTPAVIALLLQHIAVTIAALSIVRERRSGTMELFRVSPVSSIETILGKYISYLVFGLMIGAVLAALIYFGLRVPMLGSWVNIVLVGLALLFASLGFGFIISIVADTESQAVQLAMIALLLSVFFSGFFLDLRYFYPAVTIISYLLPATYAINLLQNIMLRGAAINGIFIGGLLGLGILAFLIAWLLLRRLMARR